MTRSPGLLIALEGIDGAGKSTLQSRLAARLRAACFRVARWREPSDDALGARAQAVGSTEPWTAALIFTLDRVRARPALERRIAHADVVLSDRSFFSTLAYQGSALPSRERQTLVSFERSVARIPDVVLWLRLPVDVALARVGRRGRARAPLEKVRTLRRVDREYARLARRGGWVILDGRRDANELAGRAAALVERRRVGHRRTPRRQRR